MKRIYFFMLIAFASLLIGCSNDGLIDHDVATLESMTSVVSEDSLVSAKDAIGVANVFFKNHSGNYAIRTKSGKLEDGVLNGFNASDVTTETVKDNNNTPLMHIINYKDGGFVVVSATKNYYPVLAYSNENSFVMKRNEDMGGVLVWLDETKEAIKLSHSLDHATKATISALWKKYESDDVLYSTTQLRSAPMDPYTAMGLRMIELNNLYGSSGWSFVSLIYAQSYIEDVTTYNNICSLSDYHGSPYACTIVGYNYYQYTWPLLSTKWNQLSPFNYLCPNGYPAGCGAIAMAQIMKFHKKPSSYNWSNMPDLASQMTITPPTAYATPGLIKDIGIAVNMIYGPNGSSSTTVDAYYAFQNYGYNVSFVDHDVSQVTNELINNKRPVFMRGSDSNVGGHAWVCDGVKDPLIGKIKYFVEYQVNLGGGNYSYSNYGYTSSTSPGFCNVNSAPQPGYFSMNWGWGGTYDGWFIENFATPGNYDFQNNRINLLLY